MQHPESPALASVAAHHPGASPRAHALRSLALFACAIFTASLVAADKYVSNSGVDGTTRGSINAPYATVAYALSNSANGDTIHLERGSVFRETLATISNRHLRAYGAGAAPVLSAATRVTGTWTALSGYPEIKYITFSSRPQLLFVNRALMTLARYPNKDDANAGWLFSNDNTNVDDIIDPELAAQTDHTDGYWTGARVRWRRWSWWYETREIIGYTDSTGRLELEFYPRPLDPALQTAEQKVNGQSGYYIENKLEELDVPGEFYWDQTQNRLYVYPPAGVDLASASTVVEAVTRDGFTLGGGVTVNGLTFRHATDRLLLVQSPSTIENCTFEQSLRRGLLLAPSSSPSIVQNNTFRDLYDRALLINQSVTGATGTVVQRNTFERIGMEPAHTGSATQQAIAIDHVEGNGVLITLNRFTDIGYVGVNVHQLYDTATNRPTSAQGAMVTKNVFRRCMAILNDGAAIRFVSDANTATDNIILDTIGQMETAQPFGPLGHGIWLEFVGINGNRAIPLRDNKVTFNTVYGSNGHGLFLTNQTGAIVRNNTFLSNRLAAVDMYSRSIDNLAASFNNNIVGVGARSWTISPTAVLPYRYRTNEDLTERVLSYDLQKNDGVTYNMDYGAFGNADFIHRVDNKWVYEINGGSRSFLTIDQWQANESDWASVDPEPAIHIGKAYLFINDTETSGNITVPPAPSGYAWTDLDGNPVSGSTSVIAFRSKVLLLTGPAAVPASLAPYYLRSEQ